MNNPARTPRFNFERLGLRYEVLSTETLDRRVGLAWVRVTPAAEEVRGAMVVQGLRIEETGVVARLRARNLTLGPVLIPSDWILDGGKQSRVVERSVVVSSLDVVELPVRCVEKRRWAPRVNDDARTFSMQGPASTDSRTTFIRTKETQLHEKGAYGLDQGTVWRHVATELTRTSTRSGTDSYVDFMHGGHTADVERAARLVAAMPRDANGLVAISAAGRGWFEVFPGPEELRHVASTIVAGVMHGPAEGSRSVERNIHDALRAVWEARLVSVETPERTLGEHLVLRGSVVSGSAVLFAGEVAHVAASVDLGASEREDAP